ncbi:MAG: nucleotidyltransferase domain-containing protein [Acidimicrobiia bacterium]
MPHGPGVLGHGVEVGRSVVAGVAVPELGPWEPLSLTDIDHDFRRAAVRWWIGGGRALKLHVGRSWREHEDADVGLSRPDLFGLRPFLGGWDVYVAAAGAIEPGPAKSCVANSTRTTSGVAVTRTPHGRLTSPSARAAATPRSTVAIGGPPAVGRCSALHGRGCSGSRPRAAAPVQEQGPSEKDELDTGK